MPSDRPTALIQSSPELLEALRQAASRPLTADEIKRQRIMIDAPSQATLPSVHVEATCGGVALYIGAVCVRTWEPYQQREADFLAWKIRQEMEGSANAE